MWPTTFRWSRSSLGSSAVSLTVVGVLSLASERAAHAQTTVAKAESEPAKPNREHAKDDPERDQPTPLQVDYAQYGVAFAGELVFEPGAICPGDAEVPCIIGPGGGPVIRGGYRPSGPWYIGGAYQFAKLDSNNLYRLGILQELRAEMRYIVDVGSRFSPYATWALGGMIYGNEFGAETGGVLTYVGAGVEFEVTRFAVLDLNLAYQPMLFIGFEDSAGQQRDTGVAHAIHLDLGIELKTELGRE